MFPVARQPAVKAENHEADVQRGAATYRRAVPQGGSPEDRSAQRNVPQGGSILEEFMQQL